MTDELTVQKECGTRLRAVQRGISNILVGHANTLKNRYPHVDERSIVLYGAISKLIEGAKAIDLLGSHGFVDEMNALLRTQVELTVNACYLQHGADDEVMSYLHHDAIAGLVALNDMKLASHGTLKVPAELTSRVTKLATDASSASGQKLTDRKWDKTTIKTKADAIDRVTGLNDFASMLGTVYVTSSGYVHGSYKILHKHVRYLVASEVDNPWHVMFGANNVIHGVGYVHCVFARYLAKRFDLPYVRLNELAAEGDRLCGVMNADYKLQRASKGARRAMPSTP